MRAIALIALLAIPVLAQAADPPTGRWKTIDDATGKAKSVVEIYQARDGSYAGRVAEILDTKDGPNPACDKCKGALHGNPIKGMVILWGMSKGDGDTWEGGKIMDPKTGKIYSAKMTPVEGGAKLEVRGFMGFSLLGRSQTWIRQ